MKPEQLAHTAHEQIQPGTGLVQEHLEVLKEMVGIDSRSFNVNEFPGDRQTPTDMKEILQSAENYLRRIGFSHIQVNRSPTGEELPYPILMAEIPVSKEKPTVLCYAHLDKQPYMDNEKFEKWGGVPPTKLRWNAEGTRAYGRGAADDLSGVISIGLTVDSILKALGFDAKNPSNEILNKMPCNIKIIFETEEECGSHSLIEQIQQNREFFNLIDCVIITDVVNPATGVPGLITSLRGIIQVEATVNPRDAKSPVDAQTALYKMLATLIHADHSLAVSGIADADIPMTREEIQGYEAVPTSIEQLKETGGLLPQTKLTVTPAKSAVLKGQLRRSFVNSRPGHRVSGSVIFGCAGTRITFHKSLNPGVLKDRLQRILESMNPFNLKIRLTERSVNSGRVELDLVVQASEKDPHSGINGGPFPVAELQLAKMVDGLFHDDGSLHPEIDSEVQTPGDGPKATLRALHVDDPDRVWPFEDPSAKALVEIRLAPGNREDRALEFLKSHLTEHVPGGFDLSVVPDKGASPWMTEITQPLFPLILDSLEKGYGQKACLYGCGGTIPFVPKLMDALGNVPPLCLGPYDPEARMHEPGESMSLTDLLGCSRSIVHFLAHYKEVF